MIKKKKSLYRALELKEVEAARTSRPPAHEGGRVVRHMHQPPLPPGDTPVLICFRELVNPRATVQPAGLSQ
jgi:hypothetical protein